MIAQLYLWSWLWNWGMINHRRRLVDWLFLVEATWLLWRRYIANSSEAIGSLNTAIIEVMLSLATANHLILNNKDDLLNQL
jgi:hypothetical protein